jgi:alkylation response protein AidB-like acyl-CoA dehydrogenase
VFDSAASGGRRIGVLVTFIATQEQEELRATIRRFLQARAPESEVRRLMETPDGFDAAAWRQMASELGLQGLMIPEEFGGSGFGFGEVSIVLEELGRALLPVPYLASAVLAANALLLCGTEEAKREYLPRIAAGELIGAVALADDAAPRHGEERAPVAAMAQESGHALYGYRNFVLDGLIADLIIVPADLDRDRHLFAVEGSSSGLTRTPLDTMDMTQKQARLSLDGTPARLLTGSRHDAASAMAALLDIAAAALAAEAAGCARACMEMAVAYAKVREQFGRPIGSFQAIKHKCVDMLYSAEMAESAASYAVSAIIDGSPEVSAAASLAKSYCTEAALYCASENIQVHGGVGFTWEHPAHLYYRRAKFLEIYLGSPAFHRDKLAQRLAG